MLSTKAGKVLKIRWKRVMKSTDRLTLIYYKNLNYTAQNLDLLHGYFRVIVLEDPSHDTTDLLSQTHVVLTPLGYYFGKEKIDVSPKLRIIGSNTTGHPHIDVDYAEAKGVKVITLKDHGEFLRSITATAELTWGLIIALTRNICPAFRSVLNGGWDRWPFGGRKMLSRMTLGVAGLGRLGSIVATYGISFGMRVRYYDPYVNSNLDGLEKTNSLEELVQGSDVVTVHIPHEPETEGLFNKHIFSKFKEEAYFINTSRGELVDQEALLQSLKSGKLAGAAIDVIDGEFEPGFEESMLEHPLIGYAAQHDNLVITPHIAGSTLDAWSLTQEYTIRQVIEALGLAPHEENAQAG
jgi:D-3-phosphoglycerate dehydrogenase